MRKKLTPVIYLLIVLCMVLFAGCTVQTQEQTSYPTQKSKLNLVLSNPDVVKGTDFETVYLVNKVMGINMGGGPSDPRYRGTLKLDEEFAKEYFETHTWKNNTQPLPALVNIDTKPLSSETWYEYDDVDFDFFQNCIVNAFLFNGKDTILFDISTY